MVRHSIFGCVLWVCPGMLLLLPGVMEGMGGHTMINRLQLRHCRYLHVVASGGWGRDGGAYNGKQAPAASLPVLACCCFGGLGKGWGGGT